MAENDHQVRDKTVAEVERVVNLGCEDMYRKHLTLQKYNSRESQACVQILLWMHIWDAGRLNIHFLRMSGVHKHLSSEYWAGENREAVRIHALKGSPHSWRHNDTHRPFTSTQLRIHFNPLCPFLTTSIQSIHKCS